MTTNKLIKALQRLKVETGSIACLGCGHEHNCGIHGCAIIREAAEKLGDFNAVFDEDTIVRPAGQCLKVEPGRLRELAEADKDGRLLVLPAVRYCEQYGWQNITWDEKYGVCAGSWNTREEAEKALEAMKDE